ncbi:hypothetical protein Lrub_1463 [Legionella rubrilucens]|uniref:Uncharacterized protein n=1 Tax=Legionella rubrilucens TaxID=458 RepID=A0A0W0XWP7_9GAMM|nr:hypothetical protein [Legionella rubrilucens]KTD49112.1 hypothetical protein Lrub_1463 [Legionella rubrilucens]
MANHVLILQALSCLLVEGIDGDPACYSATYNVLMGADTWFCADGSLAYYNIPWWSCSAFRACPNTTWMLSSDGLTCIKPTTNCTETPATVSEVKLIAAIVHGEASVNSTYEEKAAIANALVRKSKAYGYSTVNDFIANRKKQVSSTNPPNLRVKQVLCSNLEMDFSVLNEIALNALDPDGIDYANGGCFLI